MNETVIYILSIILLVVGILGTFLPVLPGLLLSFCGLLIYKFGAEADLSMAYIWIFGFLTAISILLNYIIPAKTTKKYGGTRWGSIGSIVGTFFGMFFIPVPFGFFDRNVSRCFCGRVTTRQPRYEQSTKCYQRLFYRISLWYRI